MGIFSYLTTPDPVFGPLAWTFFILQILGVGAGAYLTFRHTERNPARQTFMRQLGIALMILGGVGVLIGALRLLNVPVFNQRIWFWIQALIEAGVAGYVVYYMRSVLPGLERAAATRGRGARPAPKVAASNTTTEAPRPVATTGRREARRERKRKSR